MTKFRLVVATWLLGILLPTIAAQAELERYTHGIRLSDSVETALRKARSQKMDVREIPMWTEDGEKTAMVLSRDGRPLLVIVPHDGRIQWMDIREKSVDVEGVVIGSALHDCFQRGRIIEFGPHRDCSFDDVLCWIGGRRIKYLVNSQCLADVVRYQREKDPELLRRITVSGCQVDP